MDCCSLPGLPLLATHHHHTTFALFHTAWAFSLCTTVSTLSLTTPFLYKLRALSRGGPARLLSSRFIKHATLTPHSFSSPLRLPLCALFSLSLPFAGWIHLLSPPLSYLPAFFCIHSLSWISLDCPYRDSPFFLYLLFLPLSTLTPPLLHTSHTLPQRVLGWLDFTCTYRLQPFGVGPALPPRLRCIHLDITYTGLTPGHFHALSFYVRPPAGTGVDVPLLTGGARFVLPHFARFPSLLATLLWDGFACTAARHLRDTPGLELSARTAALRLAFAHLAIALSSRLLDHFCHYRRSLLAPTCLHALRARALPHLPSYRSFTGCLPACCRTLCTYLTHTRVSCRLRVAPHASYLPVFLSSPVYLSSAHLSSTLSCRLHLTSLSFAYSLSHTLLTPFYTLRPPPLYLTHLSAHTSWEQPPAHISFVSLHLYLSSVSTFFSLSSAFSLHISHTSLSLQDASLSRTPHTTLSHFARYRAWIVWITCCTFALREHNTIVSLLLPPRCRIFTHTHGIYWILLSREPSFSQGTPL